MNRSMPPPPMRRPLPPPPVRPGSRNPFDEIPPNDLKAEHGVLGSMLWGMPASRIAVESMEAEDFYSSECRGLFVVFCEFYALHPDLDEIFVSSELLKRGADPEVLGRLMEETPNPANIERYCRIVKDRAAERKAVALASDLLRKVKAGAGQGIAAELGNQVEALVDRSALTEAGTLDGIGRQVEDEIEGKRYAVEWIGCVYLTQTLALLPGTITVLCGSAGASKSLFILEHIWRWFFQQEKASVLELEKCADFHRRRAVAQMAEMQELTNFRWCRDHPDGARLAIAQNTPALDALMDARAIQAPLMGQKINREFILQWIVSEARAGKRVLCIDPISKLVGGDRLDLDQACLVDDCAKAAGKFGLSIVLVTHPVKGKPGSPVTPHLDNMQGSKAFGAFVDSAFWLESHKAAEETIAVATGHGLGKFNRTLHCLKVRNSAMGGHRIAYQLDGRNLWHREIGLLID